MGVQHVPGERTRRVGVCAPCSDGGTRAAGDDPALGVDTGCTFPDSAALKTAVDNCLAVDPTGVACCSHGADCGAAGTAEMPDWDVSLVTSMSQLFKTKHPSTRIYRDGTSARSRACTGCSSSASNVQRRISRDGTSARASRPCSKCSLRHAFNRISEMGHSGHEHGSHVQERHTAFNRTSSGTLESRLGTRIRPTAAKPRRLRGP